MDRSYPYSHRLASRARLRKRMAAALAAGLFAATASFMWTWKPDPISAAARSTAVPLQALNGAVDAGEALRRGVRRIYPYSVVPGGVSGQAELKRVIRTDSVVAAHYASFDADKAQALVVDKPRAVHVSYRKGDKVYWTAHKVMLAPGETLLSDGSNEMRARCANRISELPQYPVEAHRPVMEVLDQPVELADGEHYAIGPDGIPVAMGDGSTGRQTGVRFPLRGASGAGSLSSSPGGSLTTIGLSGSSSSISSWPTSRPQAGTPPPPADPEDPDVVVEPGPGNSSGSSSPPPPGEGRTPGEPPATAKKPEASPSPNTTTPPAPDPRPEPPAPVPVPEPPHGAPSPPSRETPQAPPADPLPPGPPTGPVDPKPNPAPKPDPVAPHIVDPPPPTEVPEPGSLWLFGLALAAMAMLHRRRQA